MSLSTTSVTVRATFHRGQERRWENLQAPLSTPPAKVGSGGQRARSANAVLQPGLCWQGCQQHHREGLPRCCRAQGRPHVGTRCGLGLPSSTGTMEQAQQRPQRVGSWRAGGVGRSRGHGLCLPWRRGSFPNPPFSQEGPGRDKLGGEELLVLLPQKASTTGGWLAAQCLQGSRMLGAASVHPSLARLCPCCSLWRQRRLRASPSLGGTTWRCQQVLLSPSHRAEGRALNAVLKRKGLFETQEAGALASSCFVGARSSSSGAPAWAEAAH